MYRESSPNAILISGGKVTVAQLFVNMSTGRTGLLGTWDVVAFDEVAGLQMSDPTVINMLKDYMESGSFARGKEETPAEASVVLVGNTSKPPQELVRTAHLFADLPSSMIDPAFLDRLHLYLPGWEVPKLERSLFTDHFGFISDYFAEALRQLRKDSQVRAIDDDFALGPHLAARDEKAVRKTVSGFLKILHPHGEWTRAELREYLEFAMEGRRRVKEQLKKLAAHDYSKTAFSYVERDTGREVWVEVREQPEELDTAAEDPMEPATEATETAPVEDLLHAGESKFLEFKASARWNIHAERVDKEIEHAVLKSVAGFMNARGGTLLVGVDDTGHPVGLDRDLATAHRKDLDGFEAWLTTLMESALGGAATSNAHIDFPAVNGTIICRIRVRPSGSPAYVSVKSDDWFYVRLGNSTRRLSTREALEYIKQRWEG